MNQYRCENCTKEDCWYFKMRDDSRNFKDKYGELLSPSSFTWEKGCASHSSLSPSQFLSDYKSEIELRLDEKTKVLDRLDKEIHIKEAEMNRKGGIEDNIVTMSGYYASAGALDWVRKVLIEGMRETIRQEDKGKHRDKFRDTTNDDENVDYRGYH